ncbi:unnamed protein product, partial [Rotaria sp. Silwood2]
FLLILGIFYDDNLRYGCFKLLALLIDESHSESKQIITRFHRMYYECLYNFDDYYERIKSFTIESRMVNLTNVDINDLINRENIRKDLEKKIIQMIDELDGNVFVKMHRSPKDAYENIILTIPYSHGVVDCSIYSTNYEVKIVEINPFSK